MGSIGHPTSAMYAINANSGTTFMSMCPDNFATYTSVALNTNGMIRTTATAEIGGTTYPFTGSHLALIDNTTPVVSGDIVVDVEIVGNTNDLDNTLTVVEPSSSANQKSSIGVYSKVANNTVPPTLTKEELVSRVDPGNVTVEYMDKVYDDQFDSVLVGRDIIQMNSLGEGRINVIGEGGDFEIGDLIVTSSTAGKGMKQADDLLRSTTVASIRENVTFTSPTEIKQVACVYLCG